MVTTVGIAGLGLIGGSLAKRLVARGVRVVAWNHRPEPYAAARQAGIDCMDRLENVALAEPDVLMLCNPLSVMPDMLHALKPVLNPQTTTLSDVGSVKGQVREQVEDAGLADCYVGAHPMAGNEHSGFAAADPALFDEALWALTVDRDTEYWRFEQVARLVVQSVGNRIIVLDDATHDRAAAMISHMPHAVATAMVNTLVSSSECNIAVALAAGSWRDMTRVALTDPHRTRAMIEEDSENVAQLARAMADRLTGVAQALESGESQTLTEFFAQGQPFRDFKARQRAQSAAGEFGPVRAVEVDRCDWQEQLLELARAGEHIVGFNQDGGLLVQRRSALQ